MAGQRREWGSGRWVGGRVVRRGEVVGGWRGKGGWFEMRRSSEGRTVAEAF